MKTIMIALTLFTAFSTFANCEQDVTGHYKEIYHRTYKAASNTFLNNFIGRKNMFAHAFGHPKIAFQNLLIEGQNYIAEGIVEKSGKSGREVYERYMELLKSEQICTGLGEDYKKPRHLRRYLLDHM